MKSIKYIIAVGVLLGYLNIQTLPKVIGYAIPDHNQYIYYVVVDIGGKSGALLVKFIGINCSENKKCSTEKFIFHDSKGQKYFIKLSIDRENKKITPNIIKIDAEAWSRMYTKRCTFFI